jgi:hypothetical protein
MAAAFLETVEDAPDGPAHAAIEKMAGDLRFLLAELDVPARLQARVGELGYRTLAVFGVMADDRATLQNVAGGGLPAGPSRGRARR